MAGEKSVVDKVFETIKKHNLIESGEKVIVGVSGGPDSVCLLHVLCLLAEKLGIKLFAVHVNHMLRGGESELDEQYAGELCKKLGIPLFIGRHDIKKLSEEKRISLEEAGREARYRQFDIAAVETGASKIAVAHNKNDQAETVLLNVLRGAGLNGLKGMDYKSGKIIRPLLDAERKEIEDYCGRNGLSPRIDASNLQSVYTRNKVRLELIPYINRIFGTDAVKNICRMSRLLSDDNDFIEKTAFFSYERCIAETGRNSVSLDTDKLKELHPALRRRVIRNAIKSVKGNLKEIESNHVEKADGLCIGGRTGAVLHLPGGIRILRSYGIIKIYAGAEHKPKEQAATERPVFDYPVKIPGITRVDEIGALIETSIEKNIKNIENRKNIGYNSTVQYFDYDKLKTGINIRSRKNGDVFKPYGSTGTKKLKEYMIDKKIPRDMRDGIPLIAKGNEIVWAVGCGISDKYKVAGNTLDVLKIAYRRKEATDGEEKGESKA